MPSIFAKGRRASESCPPMPVPDESYLRNKRSSIDVSHLDKKDMRPPPSASAKFKAFLGTMGDRPEPDEAKRDSLRKRLSSPSTFFNKPQADGQSPPIPAIEAMDRYHNPAPRAALPNGAEYPSPTVFPENFSLSGTNSPEAASPRRGSVSWQPSYPLVVDDAYAEVPPDGRAPNGMVSPTTAMASENAHRRSNELHTPSPEELSAWPAMKPASKPLTPPPTQAPLPTPPSSAVSQGRSPTQPARSSPAPRLSVNFNTGESNGLMAPQPAPTRFSSSDSPTALTPTNPAAPAVSRSRPDMPLRRPTLIQSPPMPQPIKNLPTLTGWQGFNKGAGGMVTPNWGALAKEGGPKTPGGMGGMMSNGPRTPGWPTMTPGGPKTPGLSGFPFSTTSVVQNNSRVKKAMSEDELRRAKRAMVSF